MSVGIGNLVSHALPQVVSSGALSDPRSASSVELLRSLALTPSASGWTAKDAPAPHRENLQLAVPNPLARLSGLLSRHGGDATGADFLQGRRTLEDGSAVTLPRLADRVAVQAERAAGLAERLAKGELRAAPAASGGSDPTGRMAEFSPRQMQLLEGLDDPTEKATRVAQLRAENHQGLLQTVNRLFRIRADISRGKASQTVR